MYISPSLLDLNLVTSNPFIIFNHSVKVVLKVKQKIWQRSALLAAGGYKGHVPKKKQLQR